MRDEIKIKIPKQILKEKCSGKKILVLYWLYYNQNKGQKINCFIPKMMYDLGLDCKGAQSTKNSKELISILQEFVDNNMLIKQNNDITYSHDRYGTFCFVKKNNKNILDLLDSQFVICTEKEIGTLVKAKKNNILRAHFNTVVALYFYLKACANTSSSTIISFPTIENMCHALDVSKECIQNTLKDLQYIGLIYKYNVNNYYSSTGVLKQNKTIYAFTKYDSNEVKKEFYNQTNAFEWRDLNEK